jgi:acyl carrier protein
MSVEQRVRKFIVENFYVTDPSSIDDDTLLVTNGIVDSTGMLEVIAFLEAEFGVRVGDREMTPENLESISRIARFVACKQGTAAARS